MLRLASQEDIPTINRILNHPGIYSWATMGKAMGPLDITAAFTSVFVLLDEAGQGCVILDPYDTATFEVHTCLLESLRGAEAQKIALETIRFVFAETGGMEILTKVQTANRGADLFARQSGFIRVADAPDLRSYQLTIERWPYLDEGLEQLCPSALSEAASDGHHRRLLGAMTLMGMRGFMGKAAAIYNKHARLQGYPPVQVCGPDSLTVGGLTIHFEQPGCVRVEELCPLSPQVRAL